MQDRLTEILLYVLAAIVGLFLLVALLDWLLPGAATFMDWTQIVLSLVTILAIVFGGLFAAVKFELFRDFEPHLTISHTINHRPLGDSHVHIDVRAVLHNSSRVRVELTDGYFVVHKDNRRWIRRKWAVREPKTGLSFLAGSGRSFH